MDATHASRASRKEKRMKKQKPKEYVTKIVLPRNFVIVKDFKDNTTTVVVLNEKFEEVESHSMPSYDAEAKIVELVKRLS